MRRKLVTLPIGTSWRQATTSGVVVSKKPKDRVVVTWAAVTGCEPRLMNYAEDIEVEILREPPVPIPAKVRELILRNS